jgi:hypothetical protein
MAALYAAPCHVLARILWNIWPYLSVNSNPSLSTHCDKRITSCILDAKRTFWNYNTDLGGYIVTHLLAVLIIGLAVSIVKAYIKDRKNKQIMAAGFRAP